MQSAPSSSRPRPRADSSDYEEAPYSLPNGKMVCGPHGLTVCGRCCVDFNFSDGDDDDDDGEYEGSDDSDGLESSAAVGIGAHMEMVPVGPVVGPFPATAPGGAPSSPPRGSLRVVPAEFKFPGAPADIFRLETALQNPSKRYVRIGNRRQFLVLTDGACLNNGQADPRAGWACVVSDTLTLSARLEARGPSGAACPQTSNRAELRAAIAAIGFREWHGEGAESLVIGTDSAYVVQGATTWVRGWARHGWRTAKGAAVKNRDLWEKLVAEVGRREADGLKVLFWRVGRRFNGEADAAAKAAAGELEAPDTWADYRGIDFGGSVCVIT